MSYCVQALRAEGHKVCCFSTRGTGQREGGIALDDSDMRRLWQPAIFSERLHDLLTCSVGPCIVSVRPSHLDSGFL
nr:hypothetical protein [Advenella faeciporci]